MSTKLELVIVDDETEILEVVKSYLDHLDYKIVVFDNVDDANAYIKQNWKKIIFCFFDYKIADKNCFEIVKVCRDVLDSIPVVVFTAYWDKEIAEKALETGIVKAFIQKPFTDDKLLEFVNKYTPERLEQLKDEQEMVVGFIEESAPMLDEIESMILDFEDNPGDDNILAVYFRLLHTIKGTAGCVGLTRLASFAHSYEDYIGDIRKGKLNYSDDSGDILLKGLDVLRKAYQIIETSYDDEQFQVEVHKEEFLSMIESGDKAPNVESDEAIKFHNVEKAQETPVKQQESKKAAEKMAVSMKTLDEFMEESGELTVLKNSIFKTVRNLEYKYRGDEEIEHLQELLEGMHITTSTIQNKITEMRKVSVSSIFRPFKRLVRDLSKELGKSVDFVTSGDDESIDQLVAKEFSNCLIHVFRNSLDHGLETPQDRLDTGKDKVGTVSVSVEEVNDYIELRVIDDGRGINKEIVIKKALENKLVTQAELDLMQDSEIYNLIFESGFSTKEQVTDLSGRGVGMDMVKSTIQKLNGEIITESELGVGTEFLFKVPVPKSVMILNSVTVEVSGNRYYIPMDDIVEIVELDDNNPTHDKIYQVDSKHVLSHNNMNYDIVDLANVLDNDKNSKNECFVLVKYKKSTVALSVDCIGDIDEVVCKEVDQMIDNAILFKGATFLENGVVALILCTEGICEFCGLRGLQNIGERFSQIDNNYLDINANSYLVVKFLSKQYALSLDHVNRLEVLDSNDLFTTGSHYCIRYRDHSLPLFQLEEKEVKLENEFKVIVLQVEEKLVGLIIDEIEDIATATEEIDKALFSPHNPVKGAIFLNDQTFSVIDVSRLKIFERPRKDGKASKASMAA